jgi:hypothetical protein
MTTPRQVEANRTNARKSTGPRTNQGKTRAARGARRHGLSIPVLADPELSKQVEDLARRIVGESCDARRLERARRVAEAQVDLDRARRARHALLSRALGHEATGVETVKPTHENHHAEEFLLFHTDQARQLARLERYERRALSRRKSATRSLDRVEE